MLGKWIFCIVFCFCLSGCGGDGRAAPVINAWYQKGAASHFYIAREGDTIYSIAFAFGLDYRDLVEVNHLVPPYVIVRGQRLVMTHRPPGQATETEVIGQPAPAPTWHWPTQGRVTAPFSTNPAGRPGLSISGKMGQPIRASTDGTVVYSGDGVRGYGNLIIIKRDDSYMSAYAFNERNLVVVNDKVRAEQVIARMGQNDAGHALLYFEIRHNGKPVDPMQYLGR